MVRPTSVTEARSAAGAYRPLANRYGIRTIQRTVASWAPASRSSSSARSGSRSRGAPLAVDTRKAIALLAYLAVSGRPASRESLAALLWPEADGADARAALRRTLSVLNAGLGAGALAIDRTSVTLREDDAELDLRRFRAALGRARGHRHEPDVACRSCITALEEALALDRGEFMSGFALRDSEAFDEWQVAEAESHRRDLAGALERLARSLAASGATERALVPPAADGWSSTRCTNPPTACSWSCWPEPENRLLRSSQYQDCVRILDRELGVAPLPETTELYEAIRADRLPGPSSHARTHSGRAPIAARPALPLVGRDRELATLRDAYRSVGPTDASSSSRAKPGIGKTRLAADFAALVRESGGLVLEARAYAGEAAIAFAPISGAHSGRPRPAWRGAPGCEPFDPNSGRRPARLVPMPDGSRAWPAPAGPG